MPLTIANPSTVIGHSVTGESDQTLALATTALDLIHGRLRAIPGGSPVFVAVLTVDYLTRFILLLSTVEDTQGMAYWSLDPDTPPPPDLLRLIGAHHQVRYPWLRLPVGAVRLLPPAMSHADPETLGFVSTDRYPTDPAEGLARAHGGGR